MGISYRSPWSQGATSVDTLFPAKITYNGTQLTLVNAGANQATLAVGATGNLTVTPSGTLTTFTGGLEVTGTGGDYATNVAIRVRNTQTTGGINLAIVNIDADDRRVINFNNTGGSLLANIQHITAYAGILLDATGTQTGTQLLLKNTGDIGIGTGATVSARLHAIATTEQFRLGYSTTYYQSQTTAADGVTTFALTAAAGTPYYIFSNSITLPDSKTLTLGTGLDATITYDGTNLVINPKVVGSGYLSVLGAIYTPGYLTNRPALYYGKYTGPGAPKPTPVERGGVLGFSMPIYAGDDEELFFRDHVPGRWNGASDITVEAKCYIDTANTAGEKFQFQLSWYNSSFSGVTIAATTTDVKTETTIVSGTQYAAYTVSFTVDWDVVTPDIAAGDLLSMRLRRIAVEAGGDECEGEIVVADITVKYQVDKVYKAA
jgi:hypothetical protein